MKNLSKLIAVAILLSGCGIIETKDVDSSQVQQNIYNTAKVGTVMALDTMFAEDDLEEKLLAAGVLAQKIEHFALPLLSNPNIEITRQLEGDLLAIIPDNLQGFMAVAYETLHTHYSFPTTGDLLQEPYLSYLRAFLSGVKDGAESVLVSNNAHIDSRHSIHTEDNHD